MEHNTRKHLVSCKHFFTTQRHRVNNFGAGTMTIYWCSNYQQFEVLTYFLRFRQISTACTCVWSSSPPSVSWLKLTLDPEWCLVRVCAGWQGRVNLGSEERAVSRDVSLGSAMSPSRVDDSAVRHSKASPSWACIPVRNQEYTFQYYINIYLCFSWNDLALTTI